MSKVSLFGGGGYIGRELQRSLTSSGHTVNVVSRDALIDSATHFGHVIYCSGITQGDFKSKLPEIVEAHVSRLSKLVQLIKCDSFLYLSSARIYENQLFGVEDAKISCDPLNLSDCYNLSKLLGESIVMNSSLARPSVARISYVVDGLNDHFFAPIHRTRRFQDVILNSHPDTEKDFILLADAVSCLERISLFGKSEIYNVATGVSISFMQLRSLIEETLDCKVEFTVGAKKQTAPKIDISKLHAEFEFRPRDVLEEVKVVLQAEMG